MNKKQKEQIKYILETLGYKEYRAGSEVYYLPNRRKIRFTRKVTEDKLEELFGPLFKKGTQTKEDKE